MRVEADEEVVFLTIEQVKALHQQVILRFSPGESLRVRDEGLLSSAVAAPQASWGGMYLHQTIGEMAAALMYSLDQNHAFEQGNKRIALAAADFFLRLNGYALTLNHDAAVELTLNLVNGVWNQEKCAAVIEGAMVEL